MQHEGIQFPVDGGPIMEGTWYDPNTGDSFTVRDSFFQDNQLMVQTTDGRMLDYNTIQNYIKSDKPLGPIKKPQKPATKELPKEIASEIEGTNLENEEDILEEDLELIKGSKPGRPATPEESRPKVAPAPQQNVLLDEDDRLVARVLSRASQFTIDFTLNWNKFPKKQMEMLIDYMGIDPERIADYYINKLDINDLRKDIAESIQEYVRVNMEDEQQEKTPTSKKTPRNKKNQ